MSLTFTEMWKLITDNHCHPIFTRELLVGIFWEETMFTNRKQVHGPAVGFGQVEPPTINAVNKFFKLNFSETLILIYDPASVQIASRVLEMYNKKGLSKMGSLHAYAGSSVRPANKVLPQQWTDCEAILLAGGVEDREVVKRALIRASPKQAAAVASVL